MIDVAPAAEREVQERQESRPEPEDPSAQVLIFESLGSGIASDVYRVVCNASNSRCVRADVCDEGPFFDTNFKVVVTVPGAGNAITRQSGAGGCSTFATQCRSFSSSSVRGIVVVQEVNTAGFENYSTLIQCTNSSGGVVSHTVFKVLDQ